jgi:hypothetical protein
MVPGLRHGTGSKQPISANFPATTGADACSSSRQAKINDLNDIVNDLDNLLRIDHSLEVTGRGIYALALGILSGPVVQYDVICDTSCNNFAFYDPSTPGTIGIAEAFWESLIALAPQEIRASIVLHELVHLINNEVYGGSSDIFPSSGQSELWQDEFSAALVQMDFLNVPECMQDAFAEAYADSRDSPDSSLEIAWDALLDVLQDCLGLSRTWAEIVAAAIIAYTNPACQ